MLSKFPFVFYFVLQGLLAAIPLSYILPGLIFIKLDPHSLFSREKLPAIALVIFGLIVSISGKRNLAAPKKDFLYGKIFSRFKALSY